MITVATVPNCQQCRATIKRLTNAGHPPKTTNYQEDKTAQDIATRNGWTSAPVVYCTDQDGNAVHSWHGYNPHTIDLAIQTGYAN